MKMLLNLLINDYHLMTGSTVITLDKVTLSGIWSILVSKVQN